MVDRNKYLQKMKELYEQKTGQKISDELAFEYFSDLVTLVSTIYKPIIKHV